MPDEEEQSGGRWLWWVAISALVVLLLAAAAGGLYYRYGGRVWTDGADIRVADGKVRVRDVIWTRPRHLGKAVNTARQEYEPALSPDGETLYFVRGLPGENADLYVSRRAAGSWTEPVPLAEVNTAHDELGPHVSADGELLLFYSDRPGGEGQYDLWAVRISAGEWGEPFNLGPAVNSRFNDYSPSLTPDGKRLFFASNRREEADANESPRWRATIRQDEVGDYDLYLADATAPATAPASAPTTAPAADARLAFGEAWKVPRINSPRRDGPCFVSPAGDFLYFASNRLGGAGGFDLYRCRLIGGECGEVEPLGVEINTPANETDPVVTMGGFRLYFSSDRGGEPTGYDLLTAESREVYAVRDAVAAPQLAWSWWALIIALAALVPLLLFLRAAGYRHLSLLQKCVAVSLLVHIAMTMLMSLFFITRPLLQHVAEAAGLTTSVNLEVAEEVQMRMQIRSQLADLPVSELPVRDPTLAELTRPQPTAVDETAAKLADLNVPHAEVRPAPMTVQPEAPARIRPAPAERISLPRPVPRTETPAIRLAPDTPIAETERRPEIVPDQPRETRRVETAAPPEDQAAKDVQLLAQRVRPKAESIAEAALSRPESRTDMERVTRAPEPPTPVRPDIAAPRVPVDRIASVPADPPAVNDVQAASSKVRTTGTDETEAALAALNAPRTDAAEQSLAIAAPTDSAPAAPAVEKVTPTSQPAVPAAVRPAAPKLAAPRVAERAPTTAPAALAVATTPKPVQTVGPTDPNATLTTRAAPAASLAGASLAEAPAADRPATAAPEKVSPTAVPTTPAPVRITAPRVTGPRVAAAPAPPTPPAVQTADAAATPTQTGSPEGQAAFATLAVPSSSAAGNSLAVAASVSRPARPATASVAIDVVAAVEAPRITLPVLARPTLGSEAEPVPTATAFRTPEALASRPLNGTKAPEAAPETLATAAAVTPADAVAASMVRPELASAGRPREIKPAAERIARAAAMTPLLPLAVPGRSTYPDAFFQRSVEQRQQFIEAMGGSKESEQAVAKALAYLARNQEKDGHWHFNPKQRSGGRRGKNDIAVTGLAALCFLAADHTPAKPGPYQQVVKKAADFISSHQKPDGDLRLGGDMYSHAIATLAVAEAAAMTEDPYYRAAAIKAGMFILNAQNRKTGGWRYHPGDPGDTSVLGWQVMALHSLERGGMPIPDRTKLLARKWLDSVSRSRHRMLAGYTNASPTLRMTAEAVASRIFLGQQLTPAQIKEACDYVKFQTPRDSKKADYYYWYYGSLALMQTQNDAWRKWNEQMQATLKRLQERDGSWNEKLSKYGPRGGRIYATALATLTLEVYYRYLPMYAAPAQPAGR